MDRNLISHRIGSILDDISRLSNALYAMDTTDIQRYPDNYSGFSVTSFSINFFMVMPPCSIFHNGRKCKVKGCCLLVPTQDGKAESCRRTLTRPVG